MKTRCFSRGNENQGVHVEFSVHHHPLRIPIPMLEKKIWFNKKTRTKLPNSCNTQNLGLTQKQNYLWFMSITNLILEMPLTACVEGIIRLFTIFHLHRIFSIFYQKTIIIITIVSPYFWEMILIIMMLIYRKQERDML